MGTLLSKETLEQKIKKDRMEIRQTKTDLDKAFAKSRTLINKLFKMKDPVKAKKLAFMMKSGFYEVPGATLEHALRGFVYAFAVFCKESGIPVEL